MVKIAFWDNQLCERGSTQSLYDYAYYNQTILCNKSIIIYPESENNISEIEKKFSSQFPISKVHEVFDDDGKLLDENYDRRITRFLKEFEWYVSALSKQRESGTPY